MFKRNSLIFCIAVFAMVCLFMSSGVFAGDSCLDDDYRLVEVKGAGLEFPIVIEALEDISWWYEGMPLKEMDMVYSAIGSIPSGTIFPVKVFAYVFENTECTYSHIVAALPNPATYCPEDNPDDNWNVLASSGSQDWAADSIGYPVTGWYVGDESIRVLQCTPDNYGFFIVTTNNVAAHPTPVLVKAGKKYIYRTLSGPNCWVPPPPIAVSGVSVSTPEGCTITINQTPTGPEAEASCPGQDTQVLAGIPTDKVYLGFPEDDQHPCNDPSATKVDIDGIFICMMPFKFLSDQAFGRVGENSVGWYYWNGKWYSYTY